MPIAAASAATMSTMAQSLNRRQIRAIIEGKPMAACGVEAKIGATRLEDGFVPAHNIRTGRIKADGVYMERSTEQKKVL
jgi:hypothetical protein